jgi:DNA-binding transcriptional ArsR family regulator
MPNSEIQGSLEDPQQEGISLATLAKSTSNVGFANKIGPMAELFKLLNDATRMQIIRLLSINGEMHVNALCEAVGQTQPAISHHLALLRIGGITEPRRDGKHNYYSLVKNSSSWNPFQDFLQMIEYPLPVATSTAQEEPSN